MRKFFCFYWQCIKIAARGNAPLANDWQWVFANPIWQSIGAAIGGALRGYVTKYWQRAPLMSPDTPIGILLDGLFGFAATWVAFFLVKFLNAPVSLYHGQKDRADKLEGLRQLANGVSRTPSFDIGFDVSIHLEEIDHFNEYYRDHSSLSYFDTQEICRIWVENLELRAISDCRIVIGQFHPDTTIKNGVMLLPDNRCSNEETSAQFEFASSEKRYFKFLQLTLPLLRNRLTVVIKSDQDPPWVVLRKPILEFGKRYYVTIAVHGSNANGRRIDLTIDVISEKEIVATKSSSAKQQETV